MAKRLTDIACKKASCGEKKILKLGDGEGLYLWVLPKGEKYWRFRYFIEKKEKSLSLGVYPEVNLVDARQLAREYSDMVDAGIDPSKAKKAKLTQVKAASEHTFESVSREWFKKMRSEWSDKHADDVQRRLEINLFPYIGSRPIAELETIELLKPLQIIENRGATDLPYRILTNMGQVFRYAMATGRCKYDITVGLKGALTPHVKKNQPSIHQDKLPKLIKDLATYHQIGDMQTQLGLQLMAHVFLRTNELIWTELTEIDLDEDIWRVPGPRMKMDRDHLIPLSPEVKSIIQKLIVLGNGSKYLLPGRNAIKPISNNTLLFALYRLGYKGVMTGHGFRSLASTILNEKGFNPDAVERQLAHVEVNKVRGAYNKAEYINLRRPMLLWWSEYLSDIERGRKTKQPVIN